MFNNTNVIYAYTRRDAIDDGVPVDVSEVAKEAGFKIPVAITHAVQVMVEDIPEKYSWEDYNGRLWDLLYMAAYACKSKQSDGDIMLYDFILHIKDEYREGTKAVINKRLKSYDPETVRLKLHIGPGDDYEPVITIMKQNED